MIPNRGFDNMENEDKLEKAVRAIKSDESILNCVLEMVDTIENKEGNLNSGDDAEEAVVGVIQKAGVMMLEKWAEKKSREAESQAVAEGEVRPHEKKNLLAHVPWRYKAGDTGLSFQKKESH